MRGQTIGALAAVLLCPRWALAAPLAGAAPTTAAWFAVAGVGLLKLADGRVDQIDPPPEATEDDTPAPDGGVAPDDALLQAQQQRIPELVAASGDTVWILSPAGIGQVHDHAIEIEWVHPPGSLHLAIQLDPSGTPWALTSDTVGHRLAKGHWQIEDHAEVGLKNGLFRDLAIDAAGTVWLATSDGLRRRDTAGWHSFATPGSQRFLRIAATGDTVAALASDALVRIHQGALQSRTPIPHKWVDEEILGLAIDAAQNVFVATRAGTLARVRPSGQITTWTARWDLQAMTLRALAVDGQGRLWVATDTGLALLTGDQLALHPFATIPDLAGPIQSIALTGAGPALPPPVAPVKLDVSGHLLVNGAPAPKVPLLLCPTPSEVLADPCGDAPIRFEATTDAQGAFLFPAVPAGVYGLAWKQANPPVWNVIGDSRAIRGTDPVDLGELSLQ